MTMMKTAQINRYAILLVGVITFPLFCVAQLNVYAGAQNDNHCKLFYLVNPTDHFFYIAGLGPNDLANCQTFAIKSTSPASPIEINISNDYHEYALLLPRDTITYRILIPEGNETRKKLLILSARKSSGVIPTNEAKKRNRQIGRLPETLVRIPVIE